ncbi:MAG: hypothetical protein SFW35_08300 [Chitinophagales bacterium]|nr:hypothetical protein [Chitinophagales bacterium]
MKNIWIAALVILMGSCAGEMVPQSQIPNRAQTNLQTQYPSAQNVEWSKKRKDKVTTYTATFKNNGEKMKVTFNEQGNMLQ